MQEGAVQKGVDYTVSSIVGEQIAAGRPTPKLPTGRHPKPCFAS